MVQKHDSKQQYPKPKPKPDGETRFPKKPFPFPRPGDVPCFPKLPQDAVFLVIRNALSDQGDRPVATLGGGSPDIVVDGPTTTLITLTGMYHLVPAPGSEQSITARIWNFGSDASVAARIRFWEVRTLQGSAPQPVLIGETFRGVPSESTISVPCPVVWAPTNPHRVSVMVDVSDTVKDPVTVAFDPFADRHVAQQVIVSN